VCVYKNQEILNIIKKLSFTVHNNNNNKNNNKYIGQHCKSSLLEPIFNKNTPLQNNLINRFWRTSLFQTSS